MPPTWRWASPWDMAWRSRSGDPRWTIAGFAIAAGWAILSLHNDCRYKAFFQRLKSTTKTYRVDGGGGGRPHRPPPGRAAAAALSPGRPTSSAKSTSS